MEVRKFVLAPAHFLEERVIKLKNTDDIPYSRYRNRIPKYHFRCYINKTSSSQYIAMPRKLKLHVALMCNLDDGLIVFREDRQRAGSL